MKKQKYFDCPSCGNPLVENNRPRIKCPYCETIIIPKNSKIRRKEQIYVKDKTKENN